MTKEPYRIFWDDPLWLVHRTAMSQTEENRLWTVSGQNALPGATLSPQQTAGEATGTGSAATKRPSDADAVRESVKQQAEYPENTPEPEWIPLPPNRKYDGSRKTDEQVPDTYRSNEEPYQPGNGFRTTMENLFPGIQNPTNVYSPDGRTAGSRIYGDTAGPEGDGGEDGGTANGTTLSENERSEIHRIVNDRLSELRVYVLESDITDAQQAVKSVVEQASF